VKFFIYWICSFFMFSTAVFCQPISWTGTWDTTFSKLQITQKGNQVTGYYEHDNGKISGTVQGNRLIGTWHESGNDEGKFQFVMSSDGNSFSGKWGRSSGPLSSTWNGTRLTPVVDPAPAPPRFPKVCGMGPEIPPLTGWS